MAPAASARVCARMMPCATTCPEDASVLPVTVVSIVRNRVRRASGGSTVRISATVKMRTGLGQGRNQN